MKEGIKKNFFAELKNLQDIFSHLINQSSLEFEPFKFDYFSHDSLTHLEDGDDEEKESRKK